MKNIDLLECAMRRLNLQYNIPFRLFNNPELYKITEEYNHGKKEVILSFCNEFTHGEFKKDSTSSLFSILFGNDAICTKCDNLDWTRR